MKTKITLLAFALVFFAISANAQTTAPTKMTKEQYEKLQEIKNNFSQDTQEPIKVATVNIYNAKIASQNGSQINLDFTFFNREQIQPQVRYAVSLVRIVDNKEIFVDKKVYDETLTLSENQSVDKSIVYQAPEFLSGKYAIYIESQTSEGLILANAKAGEVMLLGSGKYVFLDMASCYLTIGDNTENKYSLSQWAGVDVSEKLLLNCNVENKTEADAQITPQIKTNAKTVFVGQAVAKNLEAFTLKSGERAAKVMEIAKGTDPQRYVFDLMLNDSNGKQISEMVQGRYMIQGASATIQNIRIDKNSYAAGDTAKLALLYSATDSTNARQLFESNDRNAITQAVQKQLGLTIKIDIADSAGNFCASQISKTLDGNKVTLAEEIGITTDCPVPQVKAQVLDQSGKVLAESIFKTGETTGELKTAANKDLKNIISAKGDILKTIFLAIAILIPLVVIIVLFTKRRKAKSIPVILLAAFLAIGAFAFLGEAKADTFVMRGISWEECMGSTPSTSCGYTETDVHFSVSVTTNKDTYNLGETITAVMDSDCIDCRIIADTRSIIYDDDYYNNGQCNNPVNWLGYSIQSYTTAFTFEGQRKCLAGSYDADIWRDSFGRLSGGREDYKGSSTFIASTAGSGKSISLNFSPGYDDYDRGGATWEMFWGLYVPGPAIVSPAPIDVIDPAAIVINGACGSSGPFATLTASEPTLCQFGNVINFLGSGPWRWTCQGSGVGHIDAPCTASKTCTPNYTYTCNNPAPSCVGHEGETISGSVACTRTDNTGCDSTPDIVTPSNSPAYCGASCTAQTVNCPAVNKGDYREVAP